MQSGSGRPQAQMLLNSGLEGEETSRSSSGLIVPDNPQITSKDLREHFVSDAAHLDKPNSSWSKLMRHKYVLVITERRLDVVDVPSRCEAVWLVQGLGPLLKSRMGCHKPSINIFFRIMYNHHSQN